MTRRPLFLARRSYRRRRLHDVARALPLFAMFLMLLPMLWGEADSDLRFTGQDAIYLFVVWVFLVIVARLLATGLTEAPDAPDAPAGSEGDD